MQPVSVRTMNLAHFADQAARRHAGHNALIWGDKTWDWAKVNARVNAMAYALRHDYGVTKGDRI
ncbi:hypothetical protein MNBD_ALPHA07-837, partial [hydrothermal vent metagenome]